MGIGTSVLIVLGLGAVVYIVAGLLLFIWKHAIRSASGLDRFKGEWALITGASDGIGAAFAKELASNGINVVIMARSIDKLKAVEAECSKRGVSVQVIPFDFYIATDEMYASLKGQLSDLNISILVNNVGVNVEFPTDFMETSADLADRIVRVNVNSSLQMTRQFLPPMIAQKKGCVLFMSSGGGTDAPSPKLSVYAGTKAFVDSFAKCINGELAPSGVTAHSLKAFMVVSAMSKIRRTSLTVPSADAWVRSALKVVGREASSTPYWSHEIMAGVLGLLPLQMQIAYVDKLHADIRKRALLKRENSKKAT